MGIKVEREVKFPLSSWQQGEVVLISAQGEVLEPRYFELNSLRTFSLDYPTLYAGPRRRFPAAPRFMVFTGARRPR